VHVPGSTCADPTSRAFACIWRPADCLQISPQTGRITVVMGSVPRSRLELTALHRITETRSAFVTDERLERLCQGGVRYVAPVLVELARREKPARQDKHLC
jgi:hypothetical protein